MRFFRNKRVLGCLAAILLIAAAAWIARRPLLVGVAAWLDVGQPPVKTDYAFALGGNVETRPFVAAALYRAGFADELLVVRMRRSPAVEAGLFPPHHEMYRRVLLHEGVAEKDIQLIGDACDSTFDEAAAVGEWLEQHPSATLTVVTDHFHTRRARFIFRQELGDKVSRVHFVSAPVDYFTPDNWWRIANGFATYTSEYMKLLFYFFRYGNGTYWAGGCALALAGWILWRRRKRGPSHDRPSDDAGGD